MMLCSFDYIYVRMYNTWVLARTNMVKTNEIMYDADLNK